MFIPQYYMTLTVTKDHYVLTYNLFGMVLKEERMVKMSGNMMGIIKLFESLRDEVGILIQNNKECIEFFQTMIDDGSPVPGYVMMFEDYLFFLLTSRSIPGGIKRVGAQNTTDPETRTNDNIVKLPDIRKLLERV